MKADYEAQIENISDVINRLRDEQRELDTGIDEENPYLQAFQKYQNISQLSRDVLLELVERITVYEGGRISIKFRFEDEMRRIREYIEINSQNTAV